MRALVRSSQMATLTIGVNRLAVIRQKVQTGPFVSIGIGTQHYCALAPGGAVSCWGNDGYGRATVPAGLSGITQVTAGKFQTCALTSAGAADCWGAIYGGNLGSPADDSTGPYSQISAGDEHNCGVTVSGDIACWGYNGGYGETAGKTAPAGDPYVQVSAGGVAQLCAAIQRCDRLLGYKLRAASRHPQPTARSRRSTRPQPHVRAALGRHRGLLGGGQTHGETIAPAGEHFVQLSAGEFLSCGLRADGSVLCWGDGANDPAPGPYGLYVVTAGVPVLTEHQPGIGTSADRGCHGRCYRQRLRPHLQGAVERDGPDHHLCGCDAPERHRSCRQPDIRPDRSGHRLHPRAGRRDFIHAGLLCHPGEHDGDRAGGSQRGRRERHDRRADGHRDRLGHVGGRYLLGNPGGAVSFKAAAHTSTSTRRRATPSHRSQIQACNLNGGTKLYWWNGTAWRLPQPRPTTRPRGVSHSS